MLGAPSQWWIDRAAKYGRISRSFAFFEVPSPVSVLLSAVHIFRFTRRRMHMYSAHRHGTPATHAQDLLILSGDSNMVSTFYNESLFRRRDALPPFVLQFLPHGVNNLDGAEFHARKSRLWTAVMAPSLIQTMLPKLERVVIDTYKVFLWWRGGGAGVCVLCVLMANRMRAQKY